MYVKQTNKKDYVMEIDRNKLVLMLKLNTN